MGGDTKKPTVQMFEKFKKNWDSIDQQSYSVGIEDSEISKNFPVEVCEDIVSFCLMNLNKDICRDDYKEFLQLVVMRDGCPKPSMP